jgi:hypothetical protein
VRKISHLGEVRVAGIQTSQEGHSTTTLDANTTGSPASATSSFRIRMAYSKSPWTGLALSHKMPGDLGRSEESGFPGRDGTGVDLTGSDRGHKANSPTTTSTANPANATSTLCLRMARSDHGNQRCHWRLAL